MLPDGLTKRQGSRRDRQHARTVLWANTSLKRVRGCGRWARKDAGGDDSVVVKVTETDEGRTAGYGGLQTCGSAWACPECSFKIAQHRNGEVKAALAAWGKRGGRVALVTFTVRHHQAQRLRTVWDAVSAGWAAATSGGAWKAEQREHGTAHVRRVKTGKRKGDLVLARRVHYIRATETTIGANGWHVHVHALLFLNGAATDESVQLLAAQMFTRWKAGVGKAGLQAPSWRRGVDAKLIPAGDEAQALGDYFTKQTYTGSPAHELTHGGQSKLPKNGNRTPFMILRALVDVSTGEVGSEWQADDDPEQLLDTWREWEQGSRGRRQLVWSQGLREELAREAGLDEVELDDQDIAELEVDGTVVAVIDAATWRAIVTARAQCRVLEAFEAGHAQGLAALGTYGWSPPPD